MSPDEQAIRELVANWNAAATNGDLPQLLKMMANDVVFLVAGQPPLRGKGAFSTLFETATQDTRMAITSDIQEIQVVADWAYCWNQLSVTTTTLEGISKRRTGDALSILRKEPSGSWVVFRDTNLLTISSKPA
jgi:uncharacterized protein (TIGR02246 family)